MEFVPGGRWTSAQLTRVKKAARRMPTEQIEVAASVQDFCLDLTEVTFGAVARCVAHGACAMPNLDLRGEDEDVNPLLALLDGADLEKWRTSWDATANLPIYGVMPKEAIGLCSGLGGRLPYLEEWLWAAWGGREDRRYPWGKARPDATRLNVQDHARIMSGDPDAIDPDGFNYWAPVGSFPRGAGRWGHQDLAGNVSEPVLPTLLPDESCSCGLSIGYQNHTDIGYDEDNELIADSSFILTWPAFPCSSCGYTRNGTRPGSSSGFRCAAVGGIQAVSVR